MTSIHSSHGAFPQSIPSFSGQISPPFSPSIIIPPFWDSGISLEQNIRRMTEENRLQILESRQQMAEIKGLLASVLRSIDLSRRHIDELEESIQKDNLEHSQSHRLSREEPVPSKFATWTPPVRRISIAHVPPSPTPTNSDASLCDIPDLELKWNNPAWLGEDVIDHPYRSRLPLSVGNPGHGGTPAGDTEEAQKKELLHVLPIDHEPDEFFHSPFGRVDIEQSLTTEQQENLAIRRIDTDARTMSFISAECDQYTIPVGGLCEPILPGRFPDEPDARRAFNFRLRRWGVNPGLSLHRLPRRELLLPNDSLEAPEEVLKRRHKTWYFTYRVWYSFINSVGPSRFPGLLDQSWESILESPPEEARTRFSDCLIQYMGYAGTSISGPLRGGVEINSIIPDLLLSFDQAVQSPWPRLKPLTDLIIDLDEFESQRVLEVRDSTRLWRGVLSNTFPKHYIKHTRIGSVGGSDSRWAIVHAEFSERLQKRGDLWKTMGHYRFPDGAYIPDATASRTFDRGKRLKQLVHETATFATILVDWKDGALHLKHAVIPYLTSLNKFPGTFDDAQLQRWWESCRIIQQFYDWKGGQQESPHASSMCSF